MREGARGEAGENSSRESLEESFRRYRKDKSEKNLRAVVEAGGGMVHHFARLYTGGPPGEDLVQAGYEGLLKAVQGFDPGRGNTFVTYAGHCILGEVRHSLRKESSYYRPGCVADLQNRVDRVIEEHLKERGEPPGAEEIARELNVKVEGVSQVLRAGLVPLDQVDFSRITSRQYESFRLPIEDRILLEQAMATLNDLQRKVIDLLFFRDLTQEEAASRLGLNQRKVSRLRSRALERLREFLGKDG